MSDAQNSNTNGTRKAISRLIYSEKPRASRYGTRRYMLRMSKMVGTPKKKAACQTGNGLRVGGVEFLLMTLEEPATKNGTTNYKHPSGPPVVAR
jgi:hypothetical protein